MKNNYNNLKKEKKIDIVLTRISNMVNFLKSEKISFDFLFPSEENIKNTVLEIIKDIKILKSEKNKSFLENFYLIKFLLILKKKFIQFLKIV